MLNFIFSQKEYSQTLSHVNSTTIFIPYLQRSTNSLSFNTLQKTNNKYIEMSNNILKSEGQNISKNFQQVQIGQTSLYVKNANQSKFIYFPLWQNSFQTTQKAKNTYTMMVQKCYLLKSFLEKTLNLRIILISFAEPITKISSQFNFQLIVNNFMKQFLHDFQLANQFHFKIDIFLQTEANINEIQIYRQKKIQNSQNAILYFQNVNTYILTKNQQKTYKLKLIKQRQQIQIQERKNYDNYDKFIISRNIKNIFFYKRFLKIKQEVQNIRKDQPIKSIQSAAQPLKNVDSEMAAQIYSLITSIVIKSLKQIFQKINQQLQLVRQALPEEKKIYKNLLSLKQIKQDYKFNKWIKQEKQKSQFKKNLRSQQIGQLNIQQEGFHFQLYNPSAQMQILIAKLSNQIKNISKKTQNLISEIRITNQINKRIELEMKNKKYLIILIRALNSLKPAFPNILQDFEGSFFEQLTLTCLQAYQYFCIINQVIYLKAFELKNFLQITKHSNKQISNILKKINIRNILKDRKFQIDNLQLDLKKLNQLQKIMDENNISQLSNDKQLLHKKYILSQTKAIILHQIGLLKPQNVQQAFPFYKEALQLLMQIYIKPIKSLQQDISKSRIQKIQNLQGFQYDDRKTRSRISHILNNLCQIELSIQVQKSLNQTLNVSKLYKKWILLHSNNDKRLYTIFQQAIDYFKLIAQFNKVQQLYNLIIQKCPDSNKKQQYRIKLYEFLEWLYLPNNQQRNKLIKGLKNSKNSLNKDVIERITQVYKYK